MQLFHNNKALSSIRLSAMAKAALLLVACFGCLEQSKVMAQANITYVEYYLDQDPGQGRGTPVTITPGVNLQNIPITINVNNISRGVHILATRARTAAGVWSFSHYWYLFRPYIELAPQSVTNITKVEYFVDTDPGFGNATNVPITNGTNLVDLTFNINANNLAVGPHIVGARAMSANGAWSKTNFWLFYKPYANMAPSTTPNINRVEYFLNTDPGFGRGTPLTVTPGVNLENLTANIPVSALASGPQLLGMRALTANGSWSMTNYLMFIKPYANLTTASSPNVSQIEYYLDYDPGYGNGIQVPVTPGQNFADLTFNVNLTGILPGTHFVVARARDVNGSWSKINSWQFTIPGTAPVLESIVNGNNFCAGGALNVGFNLPATISFNSNNLFIAQISDANGSFAAPRVIGSLRSTSMSGVIPSVLPEDLPQGSGYRIRVISTNQSIVGANNATSLMVYSLPPKPVYTTPLGGDTTICAGNPLTFRATNIVTNAQWLFNDQPITNAISSSYTINNVAAANAGTYRLRLNNTTCITLGDPIVVNVNTNVPQQPNVSPSGNIGICLGSSQTLTSSVGTNNQWFRNGEAIPGATNSTFNVTSSGTYTVVATNPASGCTLTSPNSAVIALGAPLTPPTILANGPTAICSNSSVMLTASSASSYQWTRNNVNITSGGNSQNLSVTQAGVYRVVITGNNCTATSDSVVVTVSNPVAPSVQLNTAGASGPAGTTFTFTAVPTNGGPAPTFNFLVNGNSVQNSTSNTFSSNSLANGSTVSCVMTSNATCITQTTATSNSIPVTIISNVILSGRFQHPTNGTVPSITVRISGGLTDSVVTDATGRYSSNIFQQRNYSITGNKNNDANKTNGINVLDVLQMQAHILNRTLLNSPYRIIAADANSDNAVNILDVLAVKRMILGFDDTFAGGKLWSFVDSTYTFPNPTNPFPYNSSRSLTNVSGNQSNVSFYAVKLGDVNFDWAAVPGQNRASNSNKVMQLYYDTVVAERGETVRLKLKVRNFTSLVGAQFAISYDATVFDFVGIENKHINIDHNATKSMQGVIGFVWADATNTARTLTDGTVIMDVVLRKKRSVAQTGLSLDEVVIPGMAFNQASEPVKVAIGSGVVLDKPLPTNAAVAFERLEVSPNPSRGYIRLVLAAKEQKKVTVIATDAKGKLILQKAFEVIPGVNVFQMNLQEKNAIADGMYYIKAIGLEGTPAKSLVIAQQ
ncbi:MAG: cohesin domain-containing protein [Chitinophagaceae bacterium]